MKCLATNIYSTNKQKWCRHTTQKHCKYKTYHTRLHQVHSHLSFACPLTCSTIFPCTVPPHSKWIRERFRDRSMTKWWYKNTKAKQPSNIAKASKKCIHFSSSKPFNWSTKKGAYWTQKAKNQSINQSISQSTNAAIGTVPHNHHSLA